MKKIVAIICVVVIAMAGFAACGGNGDNGGAGGGGGGFAEDETIRLRIANNAAEAFHMNRAMMYFGNILETEGNFIVELYPGGQLGMYPELLSSILFGDVELVVTPTVNLVDFVPEIAFIEMPFVFASREVAFATLKGPWGQYVSERLSASGYYNLGFLENGLRHLTNNVRPVTEPAHLSGLRLRTMPVMTHVYFWQSLGASAEGSPFPELYTNLATGVFDGQENPIAHIYSSRFYEVQAHMSLTGHVFSPYAGIMAEDFVNALTDSQLALIKYAWDRAFVYQQAMIQREESGQLEHIQSNSAFPTEVTVLTPAQIQVFMDAATPTHEHFMEEVGRAEWDAFQQAVRDAENSVN